MGMWLIMDTLEEKITSKAQIPTFLVHFFSKKKNTWLSHETRIDKNGMCSTRWKAPSICLYIRDESLISISLFFQIVTE